MHINKLAIINLFLLNPIFIIGKNFAVNKRLNINIKTIRIIYLNRYLKKVLAPSEYAKKKSNIKVIHQIDKNQDNDRKCDLFLKPFHNNVIGKQ